MPARRFNKSTAIKYRLLDICAAVCGCALAAALVFYVIFSPFFFFFFGLCDFVAGDCVLADRVGKYVFGFSRGDSVIYKTGNKLSHTREIGRIVAFAGERFTVRGGLIYIDNKLLDESDYAVPFDSEIDLSELIPTDCFLVLPDDRSELAPQQVQAFIIPRSRIIGEIRLRLFPLNEIAVFS